MSPSPPQDSFGNRSRIDLDPFEQALRDADKYPPLSRREMAELLSETRSHDPEMAAEAESLLFQRNLKWIAACVNEVLGARDFGRPCERRNEAWGNAQVGFVDAIRHYDPDKVNGSPEEVWTAFLSYSKTWIQKYAREQDKREVFGLKEDAALDRKKVIETSRELRKELGRMPTNEEIYERRLEDARASLAAKGNDDPTALELRREGRLTLDRIKALRRHSTDNPSLNAAAGKDSEDLTLAEVLPDEGPNAEHHLAARQLQDALAARLRRIPGRMERIMFRALHGLQSESGTGRYEMLNGEEVSLLLGRSRDTIMRYNEETMQALRGETMVDAGKLRHEETGRSVADIEELGLSTQEARAKIREQVDMVAFLRSEGVPIHPAAPDRAQVCPFEETDGRTFRLEGDTFSCTSCGIEGDVVDWLREKRDLGKKQALRVAAELASGIPADTPRVGGKVVVTRDPKRKNDLKKLRSR